MNTSHRLRVTERAPYVRILALNGGGARCWSALVILEQVMKAVSKRYHVEAPKPCQYFHLIVGSEWGAILAILLGRLRLSIPECRQWLRKLVYPWSNGFSRIFPGVSSRRSKYYRQRLRELVKSRFQDIDGELSFYDKYPPENNALTMVLATDPTRLAKPKRFRSYSGDNVFREPDKETPIWKVALAAISTPLDLDPVKFPATDTSEGYTCIASSLAGFSNPSWISLIEAQEHFDPNSVHAVLNIGCGGKLDAWWPAALSHTWPIVRGLALMKMAIGQINDANGTAVQVETHRQMLRESANTSLYYQYFSAPTVQTSYYDWSENSRKQIEERTKDYLDTPDKRSLVSEVASQLVNLQDLPTHASVPSNDSEQPPPPLIDIEENPTVGRDQASSSALPAESRKSLHDTLRIPSRGRSSLIGELQDAGPSAKSWLADFKKTLDLFDCFDEAYPPVKLAILDTGIDAKHPWISKHWVHRSDMAHFYDFTKPEGSGQAVPDDETGHGTHMAGLILQIAPSVDLYVLRVFTDRRFGGDRDIGAMERVRKAMVFAVDTLEVNIISMSFAFEGQADNALDGAITRAIENNIVLFAAASNSGHQRESPYPASDRRVFRVNAVDEFGNRMRFNPPAGTDDKNDNLAVMGANLLSTWPMHLSGGHSDPQPGKEGNWKESSGTSCSTALLSGICALTMEFGRILRVRPEFRNSGLEADKIWDYVNRPQGMRYLFWRMANGRGNRTWDGFSDVRPWRVLSIDKNITEIGKLYLDALQLGKEGMG